MIFLYNKLVTGIHNKY